MKTTLLSNARFDTWSGRLVRRLRRRYNDRCITVLTYHSIAREPDVFTAGTGVRHHPHTLERHMEYLSEHYRPVGLPELVSSLEQGRQPARSVVLTFDDGYADSIRRALAILYRWRIPMTIFPVTSVIGNVDLMWQHKLAWLVAEGHTQKVWDALRAEGWDIDDETDGSVEDYVRQHYRPILPELLEAVLRSVGTSGAALAAKHRPYLEPEEIATADPEFVSFGNHTDTHPVLSALSEEQQALEITTARRKLTDLTGRPPVALAYPFGLKRQYDEASRRIARETGHRAALDMRRRMNVGVVDPMDLSRKPAPHDSQLTFEKMMEDWPVNAHLAPPGEGR